MPVHAVAGGWRWGKSGKVYRSRAAAERQARAIYASGFREDRRSRRETAKALRPHKGAELVYARTCLAIMQGVHRGVMGLVHAEILPAAQVRHDASETPKDRARRVLTPRLSARIAKHIRQRVAPAYDTMSGKVNQKNRAGLGMVGVGVADFASGVQAHIAVMRENNLRYFEDAGRDYADDVRSVFEDPENFGLRAESLVDKLMARGRVSENRAELIAVDQTLKLASAITQARQTAAGVTSYTWSTSLDERVRPSHAELEGQEFDWNDPPITNDDGDTNHPGEDYRCRCVAIPVVDELEELDDADVDGGDEDDEESTDEAAE